MPPKKRSTPKRKSPKKHSRRSPKRSPKSKQRRRKSRSRSPRRKSRTQQGGFLPILAAAVPIGAAMHEARCKAAPGSFLCKKEE